MTVSDFFGKIRFLLLLLLFTACSRSPEGDETPPAALFPQPQSIEANPEGGYQVNPISGQSIQPIINFLGDTVPTGVPIAITGRVLNPDSLAMPESFYDEYAALTVISAHSNAFAIPKDLTIVHVNKDSLTIKPIPQIGDNDTLHYILNSTGDTVKTGISIKIQGKTIPATHPQPTKALSAAFTEAAIADFRFLDVDQGMKSSYVGPILEDRRGMIWFGTKNGGVSKYDGNTFTHFTENEGLTSNTVWSLFEDRNGNIWVGTFGGGVSKYDGHSFTHFTEKEGLSNNIVLSILEDRNGNIWFGTYGGGVSKYDGNALTHYTEKEGLSNNRVFSIMEDRSGNLWFGTNGGGASKYDGESFTYFSQNEGLPSNYVMCILEDRVGNIWFSTGSSGLCKYDGHTFTHYTKEQGLSSNAVWSIFEDKNGNLWFCTEGGGLSKLVLSGVDGNDGETFIQYTENEGLPNNNIMSMIEDRSGNLWISTWGGGLVKYDRNSFTSYTKKEGLSDNTVRSIIEDKSGNLWFCTSGKGLTKYDGKTFSHYTVKEGLSSDMLSSIIEDKSGNLWIGTYTVGLIKYDGKTFTYYTQGEGLLSNSVKTILEDKSGNLWFATSGNGVCKYDGKTFTHYTQKEGFSSKNVGSIIEDKNGNLWFGTLGEGVCKYDGKTFINYTEKEGLSSNSVISIFEDKNGNLWFSLEDAGVSKYDGNTFTHFTEKEGLVNNLVSSIVEDESGNLYVATVKGLSMISVVGELRNDVEQQNSAAATTGFFQVNNFTRHDGLKGVEFYGNSSLVDSKNRAWWGSGKALIMLDLNKFKISSQIPQPFLKQLDINAEFIDYRNISGSPDSNRVWQGDEVTFSGVQEFENYPLGLELAYDKNHLTFHFAAIDWAAPDKIQYSYRLLGLDDTWNAPSKEAKAEYRNLPHGNYTFQIRAIGESRVWSEPFEYTFTVNPPWWQTWWAYLGYTLLFFLALVIFSNWRERKLRAEKENLEQTVEERTRALKRKSEELVHSLEDLKSTQAQLIQSEKMASLGELTAGIAHEIQNPLNFVNNFSEVSNELIDEMQEELEKGDVEEAKAISADIKQNLEKITHHGKRADAIVKGMLAHSRSGKGEKEPTDINALAEEYLKLSYHGLRAKDKSFNANFKLYLDPDLPKVNVVPQDIGRVLLNLINNAFQACDIEGVENPLVTVKTARKIAPSGAGGAPGIQITVSDNGPGIPDNIKDKIFQPFFTTKPTGQGTGLGLSLSYDIVKAHGGSITLTTDENENTIFAIWLPE